MKFLNPSVKTNSSSRIFVTLLLIFLVTFSSCKGGLCSATEDGLTDADSDCLADTADNCPVNYNPDQFDGDEDGQGAACDSDDGDDSVALIKGPEISNTPPNSNYEFPQDQTSANLTASLDTESCQFYLVGCEGWFLGYLSNDKEKTSSVTNIFSPFGEELSPYAILNQTGFYARSNSSCSPFNSTAKYPPALFCQGSESSNFLGYLSHNPETPMALDTCSVLQELDIETDLCP